MSKILTTKNNKILIDTNKKIYTIEKIGATIKTKGKLTGTTVPNTGYVENLYFNTELSIEEVVDIIKNADLEYEYAPAESFMPIPVYMSWVSCSADYNFMTIVAKNEELGLYGIFVTSLDEDFAIVFVNETVEDFGVVAGWEEGFTGIVTINRDLINNNLGVDVGFKNDKLSNLFSTTPFTQTEEIELSGEYDGSTIEVTDLSGGWQGTVVPNTGYVENVYFNTDLSVEEVVNILSVDNLTYIGGEGMDTDRIYCVLSNSDGSMQIAINNTKDAGVFIAYILGENYGVIFDENNSLGADIYGWNTNLSNPFNFGTEVLSELDGENVGVENDKLTSLFSITPFTKSEENTINIKKYINEKKIPLSIKVNVDTSGGGNLSLENAIVVKTTDMTDATELLSYNETLTEVTIGNTNIYTTDYMFRSCYELKKVEILNFNFNSAGGMFYDCCSLKAVIIRELNNIENCSAYDMFTGCYHISGFKDDSYNPEGFRDGYVYIPRESINAFNDFLDRYDASYVKNQVRILEDYTVDGTTTGTMDEEKMNKQEGFEVRLLVDSGDWDSVSDLFDYSTVDDYYAWSDIPEYASEDFNSEGYLVLLRGVKQIKFRLVDGAYFNCNELNTTILCTDPMYEDTQLFTLTSDIHITLRHTTEEDFEEEPTEGYELRFSSGTEISEGLLAYSVDNKQTWLDVDSIYGENSGYEYYSMEGYHLVETGISQIAFRLQGCYLEGYGGSFNINATTGTYDGTYETENYILDDHILMTAHMYYPEED